MLNSVAPVESAPSVTENVRNAAKKVSASRKAQPKAKKAKATPAESALAVSIMAAASICAEYGVTAKVFGSDTRPSMVIKLPAWSVVKEQLPDTEQGTAIAKCFHALKEAVNTLCGDVASTWVIHTSGSFALYSKFNG